MVFPAYSRGKIIPLAVIIAALASVFFMKSGFMIIFFLIPLSFVRFRYNRETAWVALGLAAALNLILALITIPVLKVPAYLVVLDQVFFIVLAGVFTWICGPLFLAVPGPWRMIAGSCLAALTFALIFFQRLGNEVFYEIIKTQIDAVNALYGSGSSDLAQRAVLDSLTPELFLEIMKSVMLRGGALLSAVALFWISRQAGVGLARLSGGSYRARRLKDFYADSRLIWFFSFSFVFVIISKLVNFTQFEILLWNILVLCATIYLAQGIGILQHFTSRPSSPPFLRLLFPLAVVILVFTPGINAIILGLVVLLGIAENWVPLRTVKNESGDAP